MNPQQRRRPSIAQRDVIALGRLAEQRFGLHVGENPWFGGVNPVHVSDSYHYRGLAIDVSGPPDRMLAFDHYVASTFGPTVAELFHEPGINLKNGKKTSPIGGHTDHVHVALDPALLTGHRQANYFGNPKDPLSRKPAFRSPAERKAFEKLAEKENLGEGLGDVIPGGGIAGELLSGLVGDLTSHAEALMLNIALLGGGAFLVYYGAALLLGVKKPVAGPAKAAAEVAAVVPK